jgi:hypothetical protein
MTYDEPPLEWDDEPFADPQIQKDYEAALGEFLVAFNRIENIVGDVIILALNKAGREEVLGLMKGELFARKVLILDLVSVHFPEVASWTLTSELRSLGSERNNLAHGHFDQNPFDGSYHVVTSQKRLKMPLEKIRKLTERAHKAYDQLRSSQAFFWFEDLTLQNNEPTDE